MSSVPPSLSSDSSGSDPNLPPIHRRVPQEQPQDALEAELVVPDERTIADDRGTWEEASAAEVADVELIATQQREFDLANEFVPVIAADSPEDEQTEPANILAAERVSQRSWPFRFGGWLARSGERVLGVLTLIVLLALVSAIPVLQILTLGYLLEGSRRITRSGRFWAGAAGVTKAARIGAWVVGTGLCLLPIQYLSSLWYAAYLVDPQSTATSLLRVLQFGTTFLLVPHIIAAWYCGGRLRHFFWPVVAPFSMALWLTRKAADSPSLRPILNQTLGLVSPRLVEDICRAKPLTDWFLPAILLKGLWTGTLLSHARDGLWEFTSSLQLPRLFGLGMRAFVGTIAWLFVPTLLLIGISVLPQGLSVVCGFLGVVSMALVLLYIPFAQAHFATENRLIALFDVRAVRRAFRGAPILHGLSLFLLLALSLPLFLLKIEFIPTELLWLPAIAFITLMWPARAMVAWAYAKGVRRGRSKPFYLTWPMRMLTLASTLTYTFFVLLSQYIAWNGSMSMLEQHIVLVPAPFTRLPMFF